MPSPGKSDPALRAEVGSFPVPKGVFLGCRLEEEPASQSQGLQVTDLLGTHHVGSLVQVGVVGPSELTRLPFLTLLMGTLKTWGGGSRVAPGPKASEWLNQKMT